MLHSCLKRLLGFDHTRLYFLSAVLYGGSLFSTEVYAEKVEFTFAYDVQEGFPAFMGSGKDVSKEYPGTYIELLREVEKRVPIKLKLERYPWERCKAYLKANKVDGINSSFKPSRQEIGVFPKGENNSVDINRRITSDNYILYARKGSPIFYDPLTGTIKNPHKGVAAPLGYSIVGELKNKGVDVLENPSGVSSLMKMLAYDRVSGVIAHETQARFVLSRDPELFGSIEATNPPIQKKEYYILISKEFYAQNPELSEQIWDVIGELRDIHMPRMVDQYIERFSKP
jgi:polar amino acid transport system substrate-binding protein